MKKAGIRDVAHAAGVSVTTVSHALSGRGHVAPETREKILAAAARLNYTPNQIASSLSRRTSRVIGVVSENIATAPFAGQVVLGAQRSADKHGYVLMFVDSSGDSQIEMRQIEALLGYQVEGFLYVRGYHQLVQRPALLVDRPVVFIDAEAEVTDHCAVPDEVQIGRAATEHVLAAGHRQVALLNILEDTPAKIGRQQGYLDALHAAEIDSVSISIGESTGRGGYEAAMKLLQSTQRPTAIVCFNDQMALGTYQAAAELGLVVPQDLSVIGVDDLRIITEGLTPPLTSVALPHIAMGRWAVSELIAILEGREPQRGTKRFVCEIVPRGSVAPPPGSVPLA